MYIDTLLQICTSQDLGSASGETVLSENSVNLGAAKNVAKGQPLYVVITVEEGFAGGTSVDFQVVTDEVAALTTSVVIGSATGAIGIGSLTLNRAPIVLPIGNALGQKDQYIGIQFVVVGAMTAGIVSAHIAFDAP